MQRRKKIEEQKGSSIPKMFIQTAFFESRTAKKGKIELHLLKKGPDKDIRHVYD